MVNPDHIEILERGVEAWNEWRKNNPKIQPELSGAQFIGRKLCSFNLTKADLNCAKLNDADLSCANLKGAELHGACLNGANLRFANLTKANLSFADINSAKFESANLSKTEVKGVKWNSHTMRGKYLGTRGLDSCQGNAIFKRAAMDQVYLDSLEDLWAGTWRTYLFWAWGRIDYGRSLSSVFRIAFVLIVFFGFIYSMWPELIHWPEPLCLDCNQGDKCLDNHQIPANRFTPFYFSIVTYTTLGFGDIHPQNLLGEIIVSFEVIIGYLTLGLLLSVLAEKVARRS